ncbi:PEGA domain-containing protein [Archangium gephyra]|uniref:PEGA domain-containing protein n=1 Tax=Archangium gephyra TaxID=48 RepID=UPI0035D43473
MFSRPLLCVLLLLVALPEARAGEPEGAERGTLRLVTTYWADVYVDGKRMGRAPMRPLSLPPGPHVVRLLGNPTFKPYQREVLIRAGETTELHVDPDSPQDSVPVVPSGQPTPPRASSTGTSQERTSQKGGTGTLRLVTRHWASVYVDGKRKGRAPMPPISLPAGKHVVELRDNPSVKDYRTEVVITAGQTLEVAVKSVPVD